MVTVRTLLIAAAALAAGAASAQDATVTLQVGSGAVMTSQGGPFTSAINGATLRAGDRIMLSDDGSARLLYGNGCSTELTAPGVYTVPPVCTAAAVVASQGGISAGAGAVITGVAIAGVVAVVADAHDDDDDAPPISR